MPSRGQKARAKALRWGRVSMTGELFRMSQERWAGAARLCRLLRILLLTLRALGSPSVFTRPGEGTSPKGVRRHFLPQMASFSHMWAWSFFSPSSNVFFLSLGSTLLS